MLLFCALELYEVLELWVREGSEQTLETSVGALGDSPVP
jgi:hypothetical protein